MRTGIFLTLIIASGLATGCVSNSGSLKLDASGSVGTATSTASSTKVHLLSSRLVAERFGRKLDELPAIAVQVTNRGSEPFDFSPANIEAFADSAPLKVYGSIEYILLIERAAQSEYSSAEARERSAAVRSSWGMMGPAATPMITGKVEAATERADIKQRKMKLLSVAPEMLYGKTVAPGQTFGGVIRLQAGPLLSAQRLRLRVSIGSEVHEVYFSVHR